MTFENPQLGKLLSGVLLLSRDLIRDCIGYWAKDRAGRFAFEIFNDTTRRFPYSQLEVAEYCAVTVISTA